MSGASSCTDDAICGAVSASTTGVSFDARSLDALKSKAAADPRAFAMNYDIERNAGTIFATSGVYTESSMQFMTPPNASDLSTLLNQQLENDRKQWVEAAAMSTYYSWGGSFVLLVLICLSAAANAREYRLKAQQSWVGSKCHDSAESSTGSLLTKVCRSVT